MTTYSIQIPVTGSIVVTVDANDAVEAAGLAWDKADFRVTCEHPDEAEPGEFETHKQVVKGNVCYAVCAEMNVEEV